MTKSKSNRTRFKPGRKKTGGRAAGTPNKTTRTLREEVLAAAEAAGNEVGGDGRVGYWKWVALNDPKSFIPQLVRLIPQEEPDPPDSVVLHSIEEVRDALREYGVPPDAFARALLAHSDKSDRHSGTAASSTGDRGVEGDATDAS
jgi:hypothetical protein